MAEASPMLTRLLAVLLGPRSSFGAHSSLGSTSNPAQAALLSLLLAQGQKSHGLSLSEFHKKETVGSSGSS